MAVQNRSLAPPAPCVAADWPGRRRCTIAIAEHSRDPDRTPVLAGAGRKTTKAPETATRMDRRAEVGRCSGPFDLVICGLRFRSGQATAGGAPWQRQNCCGAMRPRRRYCNYLQNEPYRCRNRRKQAPFFLSNSRTNSVWSIAFAVSPPSFSGAL